MNYFMTREEEVKWQLKGLLKAEPTEELVSYIMVREYDKFAIPIVADIYSGIKRDFIKMKGKVDETFILAGVDVVCTHVDVSKFKLQINCQYSNLKKSISDYMVYIPAWAFVTKFMCVNAALGVLINSIIPEPLPIIFCPSVFLLIIYFFNLFLMTRSGVRS